MGNRLDARLDCCRNSIRGKNGAGAVRSFSNKNHFRQKIRAPNEKWSPAQAQPRP